MSIQKKNNNDENSYTYEYSEETEPMPEPMPEPMSVPIINKATNRAAKKSPDNKKAKRKPTEAQIRALERGRETRRLKALEKQEAKNQMIDLKADRDRLKMEKEVERKVRARMRKERAVLEKRRVQEEIGLLADTDEYEEPMVVQPREEKYSRTPKVMQHDAYMRALGF